MTAGQDCEIGKLSSNAELDVTINNVTLFEQSKQDSHNGQTEKKNKLCKAKEGGGEYKNK